MAAMTLVQVLRAGASSTGTGGSEAVVVVTRRVFLGDRVQLQLRCLDQLLLCDAGKEVPFRPGERVRVSIAPHQMLPAHDNPEQGPR